MDYIIEEMDAANNNVKKNYLVQNERITYVTNGKLRMHYWRILLNNFQLNPGHVMADFSCYNYLKKDRNIQKKLQQFVRKGCTTLLTSFPVYYESDFKELPHFRKQMKKQCQLDYCIGLSIPIHKLTPTIIQKCQREKLSFIYLDINTIDEVRTKVWEWIRDVNFPYQVQLIPNWNSFKHQGKRRMRAMKLWEDIMSEKGIATISNFPLDEHTPITKEILRQLGVYPIKGDLVIGSDVDYVLYYQDSEFQNIKDNETNEGNNEPVIVVKNGSVIKVNQSISLDGVIGNELEIKRPGIFKSIG